VLAPVLMMVSGGVMLGTSFFWGLFTLAGVLGSVGPLPVQLVVLACTVIGGAGFLTGGIISLRSILRERNAFSERMDAIDAILHPALDSALPQVPRITVARF
jgi:uncharacterized membrane protein